MLPLVLSAFASLLAPPIAPTGLGLRQAAIEVAHDHSTVIVTRPTAGRPGFSRVLISQSAGMAIVVPDHFSTLASCRRSHGMRKAPVVAGCLRLGLPAHVKMKSRLHREKEATCCPDYSYGCDCCCPCYRHPPSELQYNVPGLAGVAVGRPVLHVPQGQGPVSGHSPKGAPLFPQGLILGVQNVIRHSDRSLGL